MKARFQCIVIVPLLIALGQCFVGAAQAQTTPLTMPSVRVERAFAADPLAITPYQPFDVVATFSKPYCLSTESPIYSALTLNQGVLNLVLTHVKSGPCLSERRLRVPGLLAGDYRIRVSITDGDSRTLTFEAEVGTATLTVAPNGSTPITSRVETARIDGGALAKPFGVYPLGDGPVTLFKGSLNAPLGPTGVGVEVGQPFSFGVFDQAPTGSYVSDTFVPVYAVNYPAPYLGLFITTSLQTARALQSLWAIPASGEPRQWFYALRLKSGACPLGASPVYQLFNPQVVAHRWTQSMEMYSVLAENGFVGEGAIFCAPKQS